METPNFIKVVGDSYVFSGDGCWKFFVPEKYFDTKLAIIEGEYVNVLGIFTYAIYDKNDKPTTKLSNFKFPVMFLTKPDDIEIAKDLVLTKTTKPQNYRILKYYKDGVVVVNYNIAQNTDNIDVFYRALQYGNLPNTIPYDELQKYFMENISLTGNGYNVSLQLIGIVFSELCRSSKNVEIPFHMSKSTDMTDYQFVNIREIPRNVSPFTAITSEQWDEAVINSITTKSDKPSSLEKIMMD